MGAFCHPKNGGARRASESKMKRDALPPQPRRSIARSPDCAPFTEPMKPCFKGSADARFEVITFPRRTPYSFHFEAVSSCVKLRDMLRMDNSNAILVDSSEPTFSEGTPYPYEKSVGSGYAPRAMRKALIGVDTVNTNQRA